jgi:NAD(P)-dependent dehydrogenase (short-subunit alcohol dehydrogenase family)
MSERLKGKVAIVTGAGSVRGAPDRPAIGNGKAAAIVYAREGAAVMAVDYSLEAAEETRRAIAEEGGKCSVYRADVTRADDCRAMAEECVKRYGRIDILHNNVGTGGKKAGGILDVEEEDWDALMNLNLKSMFHTCKAVLPHMLNHAGGSIINISSMAAIDHSVPSLFLYTVSKAGVNSLTRCLARQFADKGIRVNGIMPGLIDSPMVYHQEGVAPVWGSDIEKMRKARNEKAPMKRMGEPWDVAYTALFLVSEEAKYITGQIIAVDGGLTLGVAG